MNFKILAAFLLGVAFFLGVHNTAFALPCTQGSVSGSTACKDGSGNNDFPAPTTVNAQDFFGTLDWVYLAKQETPGSFEGSSSYGWTVTPITGTKTGNWSFNSSVWNTFADVMIVVKSGKNSAGNNSGIFFSGYLLDNVTKPTSGTWVTGDKDLSHLTLYARGTGTPNNPVPEPTTMLLFGAGLLGLAAVGRRKR